MQSLRPRDSCQRISELITQMALKFNSGANRPFITCIHKRMLENVLTENGRVLLEGVVSTQNIFYYLVLTLTTQS